MENCSTTSYVSVFTTSVHSTFRSRWWNGSNLASHLGICWFQRIYLLLLLSLNERDPTGEGKVFRFRETLHPICSSSPLLWRRLLSCLFYNPVSSSLQAEANQCKTFELQNENFKLGQESESDFCECGTIATGTER
jgi:hypothetical protein